MTNLKKTKNALDARISFRNITLLTAFAMLFLSSTFVFGQAIVQHAVASTTGATVSVPISPSAQGNTLIIFTVGNSSETVSSISDNASNTYVQAPSARSTSTGDNFFADIWYCAACNSGVTSVTVHFSVSSDVAAAVYEVSGLAASPFDVAHNLSNGSVAGGNCTGPSISVGASDVLFALGDADNGFSGVSAPWTIASDGTQIAYDLAAGSGTYQPVFSTGAGSTHCLISEAAFKIAPKIISISPSTGPVGTSVTITGTNFGASQGTNTVAFNGTSATPTSWSATSIVVPVPSGATSGNVSVTVGGNTSPGVAVVQSANANVGYGTSASVNISSSIAGDLLVLMPGIPSGSTVSSVADNVGNTWIHAAGTQSLSTGDDAVIDIWYCPNCNSGVTTITANFSSAVSFAGLIAYEMSGVSTSSPFETGANLSQGTVSGSNCTGASITTSFTDLLIGDGDANNGFTGVSAPWIYGAFQESYILDAVPGTYQPIFHAGAGSTACLASVAAFKTAAGFTVGSGGGSGPTITSISPTTIGIGTQVTITGSGFGSTAEDVGFCDCSDGTIVSWSNTQIVAVPTAVRQNSTVSVEVGGTWTNGIPYTEIPGTITSISPTSIGIGTQVTITGSGFGSQPATGDVSFCNCSNATVVSWSNTQIVAIPTAVASNSSVSVQFASGEWTNGFPYTEIPAVITNISPTTIAVGTQVTITGTGFGSQPIDVAFCDCSNATIVSWSDTQIVAIPTAVAPNSTVSVEFASEEWTAGFPYTPLTGSSSTATEYSYDSMGRVVQTMTCTPMNCGTGQGFLMTYAYDPGGDLTTLTSNGTSIQYSPTDSPIDGAGRVTKVESGWVDQTHPAVLATIDPISGYSPSGALQNVKYGNNVYESTVYNHRVQPCRINVNTIGAVQNTCENDQLPSGNIQDFTLNYNETTTDNGNVAGFTASGQQNFTRSYAYDSLNRIQSMSAPGDACSGLSWTIDAWGNRLSQNTTGGACFSPQITVDTKNHIMGAPAGCPSSTPFCYDAAGNLLNDGNHIYTYDAENRITQVDNGNTATYLYDSSGKRVEKTVGGNDTQYLYDIDGQINTVFGSGTFQRMYVYLGGKQLAEYLSAGNTTNFIHVDHLGSTRLLTGMDQSVQEKDDYYPYGEPITAGTNDLLKFTGKERDTESGLDNFGARFDASTLGRFMTPDAFFKDSHVGDPQSWNEYAYVRNNPLRYVDPNGETATLSTSCTTDQQQHTTCNVNISASIAIYAAPGSGLTQDQLKSAASTIQNGIQNAWSGSFTQDGVTYNVSTQITVQVTGSEAEATQSGAQNVVGLSNGPADAAHNANAFTGPGTSIGNLIRGQDVGVWNYNTLATDSWNTAAHEFTHLLGVDDKPGDVLSNTDPLSEPSRATASDLRWGIREAVRSTSVIQGEGLFIHSGAHDTFVNTVGAPVIGWWK